MDWVEGKEEEMVDEESALSERDELLRRLEVMEEAVRVEALR